jgi:hypothetical protein
MWWSLPGPARYIDRALKALREGENVLLLLPQYGPLDYGLRSEVATRAQEIGTFEIISGEQVGAPIGMLASRFGIEPGSRLTSRTLITSPRFRGRVLWIDAVTASTWPLWKEFLEDYRHVSLSQPLLERTVFVVPVEGEMTATVPDEDVGLRHCKWDNTVDQIDMWLFAASLLRARELPTRIRDLLVAVIAHIALWDPEVARRLACEPPARVLEPHPLLLDLASERDWRKEIPADWNLGTAGNFNGIFREHSCRKALSGGLERRLWRAQVAVLFPEIEEFRQEFVRKYRGQWRIPFSTPFGTITDEFDLEIGHLKHQVVKLGVSVEWEESRRLNAMVKARHCLAHLEHVDPLTILDLLE